MCNNNLTFFSFQNKCATRPKFVGCCWCNNHVCLKSKICIITFKIGQWFQTFSRPLWCEKFFCPGASKLHLQNYFTFELGDGI